MVSINDYILITDINILLDAKSNENILIYDVAYKTQHCAKHSHIGFAILISIILLKLSYFKRVNKNFKNWYCNRQLVPMDQSCQNSC